MSDKTPAEAAEPGDERENLVDKPAEPSEDAATGDADAAPMLRRRKSKAPVRRELGQGSVAIVDALDADLEQAATPRRTGAHKPVKKDKPTRSRGQASAARSDDPYTTRNPITFTKQSAGELKKVVWPTWAQLLAYFGAVLVFVVFMIVFVGLLDMLFGWALLNLLGD